MTNFIITLFMALILGYIFFKIKIPGGMMVGAIIGATGLNIISGTAYMPSYAKYTAQIIAGAFIGCSIDKDDIKRFKYLVKPALVLLSAMLALNIALGFLIYYISPLDLITSLMSCIPGGMSEIPIISADMGADAAKVAALQFVRMVAATGLFPSIISIMGRNDIGISSNVVGYGSINITKHSESDKQTAAAFIQTMGVAIALGSVGKLLKIPAGILLFSMIGVICFKLLYDKSYMPAWAKRLAQILSGAYIGSGIGYNDIIELKYLIIPAFLIVLGYFGVCLIVGRILSKHFEMGLKEAMLSAMPAGASDMALISSDLGVESPNLIVLQIIRLVVVISLFPQIISFIVTLF